MPNPHRPVYVSWRDAWGDCGTGPRMTLEAADRLAREFDRPLCWAAIIDARRYVFVGEYGTRFVDLVAQRNAASQDVPIRRKRPTQAAAGAIRKSATA